MGIRNQVGAAVIAISMVVAVGCEGGSDSGWGTVIGANEPPVIRHLRVEHDDPATPGRIRAVAELRDPERDGVEIAYAWKVAGVAQPENGPEISLPQARKGTRVEVTAIAKASRMQSEPALRVVHVRNTRPEPVADGWRNARPDVDADSNVQAADPGRIAAWPGEAPDDRGIESASSVLELAAGGDGEALRYAVEVPRSDGASAIRFRLLLGPEGMWVHPASGEVTWLPETWQTGSHPVEVEITDGSGGVTVEAFSVNAGNDEPAAPSLPAKIAIP
jgi:hypothetical protein